MNKLNQQTLVLNKSWLAVQICSARRALSLIYQGHAKVVDEDCQAYDFDDWTQVSQEMVYDPTDFVNSPNLRIKIPKVIVLLLYDKLPQRKVKFSRKNIFERDNYTCQYCGQKPPNKKSALKWLEKNQLSLDHINPRSFGGKTIWENIVTACYTCNAKKGQKSLKELGWKLKKSPKRPDWHPVLNITLKIMPHKEWTNFLDLAYWHTELENDNADGS